MGLLTQKLYHFLCNIMGFIREDPCFATFVFLWAGLNFVDLIFMVRGFSTGYYDTNIISGFLFLAVGILTYSGPCKCDLFYYAFTFASGILMIMEFFSAANYFSSLYYL